jgi:hypothetical protein
MTTRLFLFLVLVSTIAVLLPFPLGVFFYLVVFYWLEFGE